MNVKGAATTMTKELAKVKAKETVKVNVKGAATTMTKETATAKTKETAKVNVKGAAATMTQETPTVKTSTVKILITGAKGQLGCELARTLAEGRNECGPIPVEYSAAEVCAVDRDELDITRAEAVDAWFAQYGPFNVVFNCAAFTNVDACETNEEAAFAVNAQGPENLARACQRIDATLVHVSTDYVFPGNVPGERTEEDTCAPLSAYGRTKWEGEKRVMAACPHAHVVRTAWLYGKDGKNFVYTMMNLGRAHDEITVVCDQIGNPTNAADLAYAMLQIALNDSYGVWHATGEGSCSWADFAEAIMEEAQLPCEVKHVTSKQWKAAHPESADRPAFSSLDNAHLKRTIGNTMRPWSEALASFMAQQDAR